jgi:hypothetical protein
MQRDIKFRGQRKDTKEWVYGSLINSADGTFILEEGNYVLFEEPEYHSQGMGCGLEDRNITDRYDSMLHGWEKAMERVSESYPPFIEVIQGSVGQFSSFLDKKGAKIFEGDIIRMRRPYRSTQTHTGDNIPNGSFTEPLEPGIKEHEAVIIFSDGCFSAEYEDGISEALNPLFWEIIQYDESDIKEAIASSRKDIWDDPEEGDLQYLLQEYPPKSLEELIDYISGVEIIGSIHDNPELLNPIK